jgi:hypothetical protein
MVRARPTDSAPWLHQATDAQPFFGPGGIHHETDALDRAMGASRNQSSCLLCHRAGELVDASPPTGPPLPRVAPRNLRRSRHRRRGGGRPRAIVPVPPSSRRRPRQGRARSRWWWCVRPRPDDDHDGATGHNHDRPATSVHHPAGTTAHHHDHTTTTTTAAAACASPSVGRCRRLQRFG